MPRSQVNELFPELLTNPVGWSRRAPAQFLSAAPANELFDPMTSVQLPGAQRPLTQGELAGARDYSLRLFGAAADAAGGVAGPQVPGAKSAMLGRVRNRARWVPPPGGPIKTWHASPHTFDEFSLSKIGTGEGSQTFGHGLYFGENFRVGNSYLDSFGRSNTRIVDPQRPDQALSPRYGSLLLVPRGTQSILDTPLANVLGVEKINKLANKFIRQYGSEIPPYHDILKAPDFITTLRSHVRDLLESGSQYPQLWRNMGDTEILKPLIKAGLARTAKSNLYRVQLNAAPDAFLDYDRYLAQQPKILQKLQNADMLRYLDLNSQGYPRPSANRALLNDIRAGDLEYLGGESLTPWTPAQAAFLRDLGIPGSRYLDAGSRPRGYAGTDIGPDRALPKELRTRNYVVWDPTILQILKRYQPMLGPVSGGVAGNMLFGGQSDARE